MDPPVTRKQISGVFFLDLLKVNAHLFLIKPLVSKSNLFLRASKEKTADLVT